MENISGSGDICSNGQDPEPTILLLLPLVLSVFWVLVDLFYSSILLGRLVSRLAAFFLTDSAIHVGSIQVSLLTGRVLFKDVHYYCRDFAIRVTDGYAAIHWWKRVGVGECVTCCSGSVEKQTSLVLFQLNGFQMTWYNRSEVYDNWGQVDPQEYTAVVEGTTHESFIWSMWKELRPSLHFNFNKGRIVFGNDVVDKYLTLYCHTAQAHYHTTEASNPFDELMHVVRLRASEVKAVMEPSTNHISDSVECLLKSDSAVVTYSWDSPGLVPLGDTPDPLFSWNIELGTNSVINYGCYANHQRHILQAFFFPNDYTERPSSHTPQPGERRVYTHMNITICLTSKGSFNIPFHDNNNTLHQIGLSLGEGSEVKVHQPWVTNDDGYTTSITGTLKSVVMTSDLSYPHLASVTTLQLNIGLYFPRVWNVTQQWDMQLMLSNVEISILFSYIDFINALIDDWMGSERNDLLHFVPVDWTITAVLSNYEIFMYTSRYNWLDKDCIENDRMAFCGKTGQITLHFPFTIYNPLEQKITFLANGEDIVVRHYIPPSNSARHCVLALVAANKYRWRVFSSENNEGENKETFPMGYRGNTCLEDGWIDFACGPKISLAICYTSHKHHPNTSLPNTMNVDINAPTVLLRIFGFLMTDLLGLKENYPGIYIEFSTYHSTLPSEPLTPLPTQPPLREVSPAIPPSSVTDELTERFLDIVVDFSLHNTTAEFPMFPSQYQPVDAILPSACTAELSVHMDYTAADTKVFLHISPFTLLIPSWPSVGSSDLGHVVCAGLQLNCHGLTEMLCGERVEYAWLMQLELNKITTTLNTLQLAEAGSWLQAMVQQLVGVADSRVEAPNGVPIQPKIEPLSEEIKYFLFNVTVAEVDVTILEEDNIMKLESPGLDMGLCKLHSDSEILGMSLQLYALTWSVYIPLPGETKRLAEVGRIDLGLVQADMNVHKPEDCVPLRQRAFLKRADMVSRRLWFLWNEDSNSLDCGCCGGCQFLNGHISRSSAPSTIHYKHEKTLPQISSLQSLKKSLQTLCIRDIECSQLLHSGLQEYYDGSSDLSSQHISPGSDTESFVSAQASLLSSNLSDTNKFYSLENVNEAGLEGHILPEMIKQKQEECNQAEDPLLLSLLPSYKYHHMSLYINNNTDNKGACQYSDTQFLDKKKFDNSRGPSDIPRTPQTDQNRSKPFLLTLPVLIEDSRGNIPHPNIMTSTTTNSKIADNKQCTNSKLAMNVRVIESVTATLSPHVIHTITSMVKTLTYYFEQRGPLAVLTGCSLETSLSLKSYLNKLLHHSSQLQPSSVHISLVMDSLSIQLVQSLSLQYQFEDNQPQCSLINASVIGLQVNSLIQTQSQSICDDDNTQSIINSLQLSLQGNCSSVQTSLAIQFSINEQRPPPLPSLPNLLTCSSRLEAVVGPGLCVLLEAGCSDPVFTAVANIVTNEISPKAVLTWEHVECIDDNILIPNTQQQEQINNKLSLSLVLGQVWTDIAAPQTGKHSLSTGGVDMVLVGGDIIRAWQRKMMVIMRSVHELLNVKKNRDKMILLALLSNAARCTLTDNIMVGCVLLTPVAAAVRQCVSFHCLYQIWSSLSVFSDHQLNSIPSHQSCHVELIATAISLAIRFYSEGNCSLGKKKLSSSPLPLDSTTCPTCGIYKQTATQSSISTVSSGGYIEGISPSPSELALPNVGFSTQQLDQIDPTTFQELYQSMTFGKVVVVRESLLPLLKAIGITISPQLRALGHNKQQMNIEILLEIKEGKVFTLESFSSRSIPTFNLENTSIRGNLHTSWTSSIKPTSLSLLSSNTTSTDTQSSSSNITGYFSGQAGIINIGITEQFMRLSRHIIESSRILSQIPSITTTSSSEDMTSPQTIIQSSDLWQFTQHLVEQLTTLQSVARQLDEPSRTSISQPSSASSAYSHSVHNVIVDYSQSPIIPPTIQPQLSNDCSSTSEVAIEIDTPTSPISQSPMDTSGGDLVSSDDMQLSSGSHNKPPSSSSSSSNHNTTSQTILLADWLPDIITLKQLLETPPTQLSHSIFGLVRVDSISFILYVETSTTSLRLAGITGCVDSRQLMSSSNQVLPSYLSVVGTVKTTQLGISDRTLTESELVRVIVQPIYCSLALNNSSLLPMTTYRCLLKILGCKLVVKQPPVLVHKRVHQLLPAFTNIYQDIFSPWSEPLTTPQQQATQHSTLKMPSQLAQGYTHFNISRLELVMTPLQSLSITYTVQPLVAHIETAQKVHYQLSIGSHTLRFNPREQQVTLRNLVLPTVTLSGDIRRSKTSLLPQICMKLTVQRVNIDLTTDSLNQLLVLQNSFIKEVNELVQLFINIGESIPQPHWQQAKGLERRDSEPGGLEPLSLLDSCHLSIDEICITVSTPLCTALRFSTSRIDMLIMNSSGSQPLTTDMPVGKSQLLLSGRVDINVNLALGYLQNTSNEDDDFCELAYFRTKISVRNTQKNAPRLSLVGGASEDETLDTFIISIICPHLYIQSSAIEQAILFWLNCKSVYSYWQHQKKLLNAEVQKATENFVAQIQSRRPTNSALDFSKPRLVQISVTDVGACMPMSPLFHTPQSSQKPFSALVLTVKEMLFVVNLSRKIASSGSLSDFCVRFANQFSLRQRTWTMDSKKNKMINCGIVNQGTFRLCVATKKRLSEIDESVILGEKLVWAFQWDMSGIDVNANSDIGHHMSTLVRTATTIGTSLEGQHPTHLGPAIPPSKPSRKLHKRTMSEVGPSRHEAKMEEGMTNLAKGTIHVSKMQSSGVSRDIIKREIEALKETEHQLRKNVGRMFRRRRGFSFQRIAEFFKPTSDDKMERGRRLGRRWTLKNPRKLFSSTGDPPSSIPEHETSSELPHHQHTRTAVRHTRTLSDISEHQKLLRDEESSSPSLTPSVTPVPGEDPLSTPITPSTPSAFSFQPMIQLVGQKPQSTAPIIASIDVEVNITVNIESGIVKLRCREDSFSERQTSSPNLLTKAHQQLSLPLQPLQPRRVQSRAKDTGNDTIIILIPGLNVQVHYKSIVGQSYQFPSPTSYIPSPPPVSHVPSPSPTSYIPSPPPVSHVPRVNITPGTPDQVDVAMKRGVLSVSVVVKSTPEDMTLTPSLLEFVEQVVRPTIAATVNTKTDSSSECDSDDDNELEELQDTSKTTDIPVISFPLDVTIVFHMQPSTISLTCKPHSRVHCIVCSPNVNFVVSFSLFSPREREGIADSPSQASVVTFNNLYVTGCLETFTLQLLSPQVSSLKQKDVDTEQKMANKEALSLTLGQAMIHLSRKSVLTASTPAQSKLQMSVVANIASLVLGYDMRRLNDLSTFRRYWYSTSLIESFIGSKKPHPPISVDDRDNDVDLGTDGLTVDNNISTAIVVAATVEDFRISANVAQVMGNTNLLVSNLQCQGHADISHNELVLLRLTGKMEKGEVDARGGMVAGFILMQNVQAQVTTETYHGVVPVHTATLRLMMAEARVDYMSSCILLGRASELLISACDLWEGLQLAGVNEEREEANIQIMVELLWKQVQLAINRTTTKSLINIIQKIQDFIIQQKRRSERTISIMLPADTRVSKALAAYREKEKQDEEKDADKMKSEHHWLWATRYGSVELMKALGVPYHPGQHQVSLGGKISLSGDNFCLVCFHGTSFRDHEWAVFNIDQLATSFLTLAIPGLGDKAKDLTRTCQQICKLQLGKENGELLKLATVHKVSAAKGRVPPITGTNINNWLAYVCIDYHLHQETCETPNPAQQIMLKFSKRLGIQQVLLVPALSVELINDHFWPLMTSGDLQQQFQMNSPCVECSLISNFSAPISVSTNVEHYLFLHDLVINYINYLERHTLPLQSESSAKVKEQEDKEDVDKGKEESIKRQFKCVWWQLEPRLTLLSSVSGEFNPHINWLLEALGFKHAQTTIPKWVQRGAMDPLDKAVALAVELLVQFSAKKKLQHTH